MFLQTTSRRSSRSSKSTDNSALIFSTSAFNDAYSGNSYAQSANNLMKKAVILQGERNQLVEENSEIFKKAGII